MKSSIIAAAMLIAAAPGLAQADPGYGGFHIEGQGGWDHRTAKLSYDDSVYTYEAKASQNGVTYGVAGGYDSDFGDFLLGTEAAINWSTGKSCTTFDGTDQGCFKFGREIEVGIRAGKQIGERGPLVYAKVAYVNGAWDYRYTDGEAGFRVHDTRSALRLGVGIEQKLGHHVYVKAEYRYTGFKDYKYVDPDGEYSEKLGFKKNQVIGGVGVLF